MQKIQNTDTDIKLITQNLTNVSCIASFNFGNEIGRHGFTGFSAKCDNYIIDGRMVVVLGPQLFQQ